MAHAVALISRFARLLVSTITQHLGFHHARPRVFEALHMWFLRTAESVLGGGKHKARRVGGKGCDAVSYSLSFLMIDIKYPNCSPCDTSNNIVIKHHPVLPKEREDAG